MTRKVLLAGEGKNELGGWADAKPYRASRPLPGALEALLRRVAPEGWQVHDSVTSSRPKTFRAPPT